MVDLCRQNCAHTVRDAGHELLIYFSEDFFLLTRKKQVSQSASDGVRNFSEIEIVLGTLGFDLDFRAVKAVFADYASPIEAWFFVFRSGGKTLEFEIFFEGNFLDH